VLLLGCLAAREQPVLVLARCSVFRVLGLQPAIRCLKLLIARTPLHIIIIKCPAPAAWILDGRQQGRIGQASCWAASMPQPGIAVHRGF
jgi:hypothetical protein